MSLTLKTLDTFKEKQEKAQKMLEKLNLFIKEGEGFGLIPDKGLLEKLQTAVHSVEGGILKVALIGGFSEGKTSIAAAWLGRLDQSMNISQQESSNEVKVYTVDHDIELIDTPGLFGFKEQQNSEGAIEKYKEITKKYVSEAHLVLYVMNSVNPIKESHKEDLYWLFRELNLLPRTVFVLSKFDEVANIESDWDYREHLNIKKKNVLDRLKSMIHLSDKEETQIKIVGVSANPFGEDIAYWLENPDEFRKLSKISTLQEATNETIQQNGGITPMIFEAQKSMIQDILGKQLPLVKATQEAFDIELNKLVDVTEQLNIELESMKTRMTQVRISLIEFVSGHFKDLIRRVNELDMYSFNAFYEDKIGKDGIELNTVIETEFMRQCQGISNSLVNINHKFNYEIERFENSVGLELMTKGLNFLNQQQFTGKQIIAARNGIVASGKMVGFDLAKYLKFKPWGAINLANKINAFLGIASLFMEVVDTVKKAQQEQDFKNLVSEILKVLEKQREMLLGDLKNDDKFISSFPQYIALQEQFKVIQESNDDKAERKLAFEKWQKEGEIIEAEYRLLG
ncbi:LeoA/HP0731 family dynamin-like GTPase [Pelistega ratti]|uniref:LeoA/HP0731 family dynamin-like GTPase n=1 Tax=Pelistega ratti TaxID=2652177 RepID=UPI00135C60A3|nr:LeoA/HP0731 family dynamin-like GTPase [Pelistega ratti]